MTSSLQVDTGELRSAGSEFTASGDRLAGLRADAPLGDAAAAVPSLRTATACNTAKSAVATEITSIADGARTYGSNLAVAADRYDSTDQESAAEVAGVEVPAPR